MELVQGNTTDTTSATKAPIDPSALTSEDIKDIIGSMTMQILQYQKYIRYLEEQIKGK